MKKNLRNQFREVLSPAILAILSTVLIAIGCAESLPSKEFNSVVLGRRFLYVASGACYAGGPAVSLGSATVAKFDLQTGALAGILVDYNGLSQGDQPSAIRQFGGNQFLVGIENTAGRRIDIVKNDGTGLTTYLTNTTALNAIFRDLRVLSDSAILVSKATAIEKFSPSRARVTQGAAAFVASPAGACATSTTAMTAVVTLPNGKIVYAHAAASPNNKLAVISENGYAAAADCLAAQAAPATTALPTAMAYHEFFGKLLVAYGSTTTASNSIYSYDIDLVSGAISNPVEAWRDPATVFGVSEMTIDQDTGELFVANGASTYNNIEKFTLKSDGELEKVGTAPFINTNIYTRCVSGLEIAP